MASRRATSARRHELIEGHPAIDFSLPKFRIFGALLQGETLAWANGLFAEIGFVGGDERRQLWRSYLWYLCSCLVQQVGARATSPTISAWWKGNTGVASVDAQNYLNHCQRAFDARDRTRVLYLLSLCERLDSLAGGAGSRQRRVMRTWFFLVFLFYYVGSTEFFDHVVLKADGHYCYSGMDGIGEKVYH